jgi:hypothetical protein
MDDLHEEIKSKSPIEASEKIVKVDASPVVVKVATNTTKMNSTIVPPPAANATSTMQTDQSVKLARQEVKAELSPTKDSVVITSIEAKPATIDAKISTIDAKTNTT